MKNYLPYILIVGIIAFLLFTSIKDRKERDQIAINKEWYQKLNAEALESEKKIKLLEAANEQLKKQDELINKEIAGLKTNISTIRKKRDEKINIVNGYNAVQLQQFFADNYPE